MNQMFERIRKVTEFLFQKRGVALLTRDIFRGHPAKEQGFGSLSPFQYPVQVIIGLRFRACEFSQISDPEMMMFRALMDKKVFHSPQRTHDFDRRSHLFADLPHKGLGCAFAEMDTPPGKDPEIISFDRVKKSLVPPPDKGCGTKVEGLIVFDKRDHTQLTVSTEP